MLVLSRKKNDSIVIDGQIRITVLEVRGNTVRLGIEAPKDVPIYRSDAVLRRAAALQAHPLTGVAAVGLHPEDALVLGLVQGAQAKISGEDGGDTVLPVVVTRAVPRGAAWVESTWTQTSALPPMGATLTVTRATA